MCIDVVMSVVLKLTVHTRWMGVYIFISRRYCSIEFSEETLLNPISRN
jgi:hypothetical protein